MERQRRAPHCRPCWAPRSSPEPIRRNHGIGYQNCNRERTNVGSVDVEKVKVIKGGLTPPQGGEPPGVNNLGLSIFVYLKTFVNIILGFKFL